MFRLPMVLLCFISGQTWLLTILRLIAHADLIERDEEIPKRQDREVPFLEAQFTGKKSGAEYLAALTKEPRIIKTHLPLELMKDNIDKMPNMKIIQTIRNPKDTLVSYFHQLSGHVRGQASFTGSWDDFFHLFKIRKLPNWDLFDFTLAWYKYHQSRENSLILIYEEMKQDLRGHILKIASFLGVKLSDKVIDYITEKTTFQNMAKDPKYNMTDHADPKNVDTSKPKFMRKGIVGNWVEYFSQEQSDYVDSKYEQMFVPEGLLLTFKL